MIRRLRNLWRLSNFDVTVAEGGKSYTLPQEVSIVQPKQAIIVDREDPIKTLDLGEENQ